MDETLAVAADRNSTGDTAALSGLKFSKGHGTGNDFVLLADPNGTLAVTPEQVAVLCDRHRGIGGDGLIRAVPSRLLAEGQELLAQHPDAEWFMDYRNGDGSLSEMCGNGVRVFVHFLIAEGLVELPAGESLTIGTRGGAKTIVRTAAGYAVDMGPWEFIFPARPPRGPWIRWSAPRGWRSHGPPCPSAWGTRIPSWRWPNWPSLRPRSCSPRPMWIPHRPAAPTSSSSFRPSRWSTTASEPSPCAFMSGGWGNAVLRHRRLRGRRRDPPLGRPGRPG